MTKIDKQKINAILNVIAKDDDLCEEFARAVGDDFDDFNQWIDEVKLD